jgi:hypothetical protein
LQHRLSFAGKKPDALNDPAKKKRERQGSPPSRKEEKGREEEFTAEAQRTQRKRGE